MTTLVILLFICGAAAAAVYGFCMGWYDPQGSQQECTEPHCLHAGTTVREALEKEK